MKPEIGSAAIAMVLWATALPVASGVLEPALALPACPATAAPKVDATGGPEEVVGQFVHDKADRSRIDEYLELHFRATGPVGTYGTGAASAMAGHPEHRQP